MTRLPGINDQVRIASAASDGFCQWLAASRGSVVVSTYQAGKVAMIGWDGRQVTQLLRHFDKPLGLAVAGRRMALATRHDVVLFADAPVLAHYYLEDQPGRYDAIYLPRATFHTGDLNTHEICFAGEDLILVNTRFSCLARLSYQHNFVPFWRPSFVSQLAPEDRCHLNGLAMCDGRPKYVTALGMTDAPGAWRADKARGGVLIDVDSGEIVCRGLSMPHSPRWHEGRLWVLNSGAGEILVVEPQSGRTEVVCRLPGYLRGLSLAGCYALVGLSRIREKHIFGGLPIQERGEKLLSAVAVVDLRQGSQVGLFEYTAGCEELFAVEFLPNVTRPMVLNLEKPGARQAFTDPDACYWLRPSAERPLPVQAADAEPGLAAIASPQAPFQVNLLPDAGTSF